VYDKNYTLDKGIINLLKAIGLYEEYSIDNNLANISNVNLDSLKMRLLKDLKIYLNDLPNNQYIKKM